MKNNERFDELLGLLLDETITREGLEELAGLVEEAVKEDILYREALRLGLDRDDTIVRRRLAQKMTFMLEDGAAVALPTDRELGAYHAARGERYREPRRTTFVHVFLSDDRRADPAGDARALLDELTSGGASRTRRRWTSCERDTRSGCRRRAPPGCRSAL